MTQRQSLQLQGDTQGRKHGGKYTRDGLPIIFIEYTSCCFDIIFMRIWNLACLVLIFAVKIVTMVTPMLGNKNRAKKVFGRQKKKTRSR